MNVSSRNMFILISVVGSLSFVVYVFVLDCLTMGYRLNTVDEEIFFNPNTTKMSFEMEFATPFTFFFYDSFILICSFTILFCNVFCTVTKLLHWYYFYLWPFACIIVHSFHILVGFIQNPHNASAILIYYATIVLLFGATYI